MLMTTLLAHQYPALAEVDPKEAAFLGTLLPELLRAARKAGSARLAFHEYVLDAHCQPLGAVLVAVTWAVRRHGTKIAKDTSIQYR
jgi:hypothetical protein